MMTYDEHVSEAWDCLQTARDLIGRNRRRQASEILWLAVKHAINALALATNQEYGKYQHKRAVITGWGNPDLTRRLKTAMRIHADADKRFMSEHDLSIDQVTTRFFVEQLLAISAELNDD